MTVDELLTQFPNARPGLEIFFDAPKTREELSGLIGRMGGRVQGLQTILDVQLRVQQEPQNQQTESLESELSSSPNTNGVQQSRR